MLCSSYNSGIEKNNISRQAVAAPWRSAITKGAKRCATLTLCGVNKFNEPPLHSTAPSTNLCPCHREKKRLFHFRVFSPPRLYPNGKKCHKCPRKCSFIRGRTMMKQNKTEPHTHTHTKNHQKLPFRSWPAPRWRFASLREKTVKKIKHRRSSSSSSSIGGKQIKRTAPTRCWLLPFAQQKIKRECSDPQPNGMNQFL